MNPNQFPRPGNRPGFRLSDLREGSPDGRFSHLQTENIPLAGLSSLRVHPGERIARPELGSDRGYGYDRIFVAYWVDGSCILLDQRIARTQPPQKPPKSLPVSESTPLEIHLGFYSKLRQPFLDQTSGWLIPKRPHDIAVHTYHLSRSDFLEFRSTCKDIHQKTLYRLNNFHMPNKTLALASNSRAGLNSLVGLAGHQKFAARVRKVTIQVQDSTFLRGEIIAPFQYYFGDPSLAFEEGLWTQHFNNPSMQMDQRAVDLAIVLVCLSMLPALETIELVDLPSPWIPVQHARAWKNLQEAKKAVEKPWSAVRALRNLGRDSGPYPSTDNDRLSRATRLYKNITENSRAGEAGKPVGDYTPYSITTRHCGICNQPPFQDRTWGKCIHFQVFLGALDLLAQSKSDLIWSMGVYQLPLTTVGYITRCSDNSFPRKFTLDGLLEIVYKISHHKGSDDMLPNDGLATIHNFILKLFGASTVLHTLSIDGADGTHFPSKTHRLCGPVASRLASDSLSTLLLQDFKLSALDLNNLFKRYATTLSTVHLKGVCLVCQYDAWSPVLSTLLTSKAPLEELFIHAPTLSSAPNGWWGMVVFGDDVSEAELKAARFRGGRFRTWRQIGQDAPHQEVNRDLVGWRFCGPDVEYGVKFLVLNAHFFRV
ncbi:hypothetical protein BU16DRAFT_554220 [Lophium mytilinum]|uniref:Uncharacterized protein n=1 Tax=Lophium mytilinum TaxID=390894 RepID=A0A6A6RCP2_9PEZI|nr:hypothetical protein BU16DRAFT_554220 [Lophium mytilinum]